MKKLFDYLNNKPRRIKAEESIGLDLSSPPLIDINKSMHTPSILLMTSAYHMKRAKKTFERQNFKVNPYPVDFKTNPKNVTLKNPSKSIPNSEA